MITRIALIAVSLFLSGCGALRQVPHIASHQLSHNLGENAARINEAYTQATNTVILTNILRARDSWPTAYTTVSGITATPNIVFTADGEFSPLGLGNAPLPFSGSKAGVSQANTAKLAYEINPFAEEKGAQNVYVPITADMFRDYWNGQVSNDVLISLFVESYQSDGKLKINNAGRRSAFVKGFMDAIERVETDAENVKIVSFSKRSCDDITHVNKSKFFSRIDNDGESINATVIEQLKENFGKGLSMEVVDSDLVFKNCTNSTTYRFVEHDGSTELKSKTCPPEQGRIVEREGYISFLTGPISTNDTCSTNGKRVFALKLRSIDEAIAYVGKWMLKKEGKKTLFTVVPENVPTYLAKGRDDDYAAIARHGDKIYYAAKANYAPGDQTGEVLSLLTELYVRSQSKEFLKAPEVNNLRLEQ